MERQIKVTGKGNIRFRPDITIIELELSDILEEYSDALEGAARTSREIKEELFELGFDKSSIKTTSLSVNARYRRYEGKRGEEKEELIGYEYNQELKFSFDINNELLGKVLFTLSKLESTPHIRIRYSLKNIEKAKDELLSTAVNNAKEKAELLAKASGVVLGEIVDINYSEIRLDFSVSPFEDRCVRGLVPSGQLRSFDVDIDPEDIEVDDSVTITWSIK